MFKRYLNERKTSKVDEKVCLVYIYIKTGMKFESFNQKTIDSSINRRMKPLHLLLAYLETGKFIYQQRRIKSHLYDRMDSFWSTNCLWSNAGPEDMPNRPLIQIPTSCSIFLRSSEASTDSICPSEPIIKL